MNKKIIYDFGSNNGDDIPYYILKSDLVIAVEANSVLCDHIKNRFKKQITNGSLIVENCVLNVGESPDQIAFYIHKTNHVLSQLPRPDNIDQFVEVTLPSKNVIELIRKYGDPYYIKIDIEHYDQIILDELFTNGIVPPYISSESHSINVFASLVALGKYNSFKLVDGSLVSNKYKEYEISTNDGSIKYSFPHHSAGPFGNDISGPWMTANNFFRVLAFAGLGWKDIHASNIEDPDPKYFPQPKFHMSINI
jgi:FkbM family methyltransferase